MRATGGLGGNALSLHFFLGFISVPIVLATAVAERNRKAFLSKIVAIWSFRVSGGAMGCVLLWSFALRSPHLELLSEIYLAAAAVSVC